MKKLIHSLANRYGYSIGHVSQSVPGSDPFLAMQSLLKGYSSPVIFDVGAYHGFIARHFRSLFPDATIFAFEPFCESFQVLKQNTESDANIKAINIGFLVLMARNNSIEIAVRTPILCLPATKMG
jgi:hypothetical protein